MTIVLCKPNLDKIDACIEVTVTPDKFIKVTEDLQASHEPEKLKSKIEQVNRLMTDFVKDSKHHFKNLRDNINREDQILSVYRDFFAPKVKS